MWGGRSRCPACRTPLRAADLVPLLSWLRLRGRCRYCGAALGAWYPLVELAAAAIGALSLALLPAPTAWLAALLGWWLLALATIDLVAWVLPDILTLPLIVAGLLLAAWGGPLSGLASPGSSALGATFGYLALAGIGLAYRRLRGREGLGLGDAKLLAAAGAWLGIERLPVVLLAAALLGLALALLQHRELKAETALPFGPALALAFWGTFVLAARA
jgi:leader peptidase (prepilin peptidase)/N-methyltransferase